MCIFPTKPLFHLGQTSTSDHASRSLSPVPVSRSCSPCELAPLLEGDYRPLPTDETVVDHPAVNLPSLGIVINLHFRCIICINCERAINPSNLDEHIHKDLPLVEFPSDLQMILEKTYKVVPYSTVKYSPGPISPVFGVPLHRLPLFFCECGKGYNNLNVLRVHQTRDERPCPLRAMNPKYHQGYGQRLTSNHPYFEVDPSVWLKDQDDRTHYRTAFARSLPPLCDYSTMEIKGAEDEMNTSSFFYTERWLSHLEGYSPKDVQEVLLLSTNEAPYGERLRMVAEQFLDLANAKIKSYTSFGILKMMGQTTEYVIFLSNNIHLKIFNDFRRETLNRYDSVSDTTIKKYALTLHRLIFGIMRQLDPTYSQRYRYPPLHESQIGPFALLRLAVDKQSSMTDLVAAYQKACYSLFAHHQHQYDTSRELDQFFSPVICFLVLSSVKEKGGFRQPSMITQYIAHIMFSIRATVFNEIIAKSRRESISISK